MEDVTKQKQKLDDVWQYVSEPTKWNELRVTKMAVMKILNLVKDYEADSKVAAEMLDKMKKPKENIAADVDN